MTEELKNLTILFAEKAGMADCEVVIDERENGFSISIKSDETKDYIGRDQERFDAFSHLLRRMAEKIIGEDKKISVDINNRRQKQDETLKTKAKIIAERAREFKKDMEMEPMSSYERMVIHTALEGMNSIKTESAGEGKNRRVVIKFIENKNRDEFSSGI